MIKYSAHVNMIDSIRSSIAAVLPVFNGEGWKSVALEFSKGIDGILKNISYGDSDTCKAVRQSMLSDISRFIKKTGVIQTRVVRDMIDTLNKTEATYEQKLQILFSYADMVKFLLYKEKDIHRFADDIENYKDQINAITYCDKDGNRICPYDPGEYHDEYNLVKTIRRQAKNIKQFLLTTVSGDDKEEQKEYISNNFDKNLNNILYHLKALPSYIDRYQCGLYIPTDLEKGFFDSVLYIRNHSQNALKKFEDYKLGKASASMFSLSESKSPISDNSEVMIVLHKLGFNKKSCPAVLSNIFYTNQLRGIGIEKQEGQIELNYKLYFSPAPGLGPAYKVRWVYSIETNINNLLTPLADIIQEADKVNDPNEAYNEQLQLINNTLQYIVDAFCTDSTGYSDYLWRGIYVYLMELYKWPISVITTVMNIFSLPVKIGKELLDVEFGTFQGCKLLVFIMNHANRLMGLIADSLAVSRKKCIRPNAGDDVSKLSLDKEFALEDIMDEIMTFAVFNCPTNLSKAAWLKRDGYFDFCSKYYAMVNGTVKCISGVPAKKYGKEIICLADWAETFKVLNASQQQHTNCYESFQLALPFIITGLQDGCKLPNIYHIPMDIKMKIEQAREIPFTYGGLAEAEEEQDIDKLVAMLKYKTSLILTSYMFNPIGVFLVVNSIEELKGTELLKAIGSVNHQPLKDIVKLINLLSSPEAISEDELQWCKDSVSKFERNIISGQSTSRTSSTYHRIERVRDVDLLFPIGAVDTDIGMPLPTDSTTAITMLALLGDKNYLDIDNIRRYIQVMRTFGKYKNVITKYDGVGNFFFGIRDPDDGKIIRIYDNDDCRYDAFKPLWECKNEELRSAIQILRESGAHSYLHVLYTTGNNVALRDSKKLAKKLVEWNLLKMNERQAEILVKHAMKKYIQQ